MRIWRQLIHCQPCLWILTSGIKWLEYRQPTPVIAVDAFIGLDIAFKIAR